MYYLEMTEKRGRMSDMIDAPLEINWDNVELFRPQGEGTVIYFKSGRQEVVTNSYASIKKELSLK